MCDRVLTKWSVALAAVLSLPLGSLRAQETSTPEPSFEVEPPLLVKPGDLEKAEKKPEAPLDATQIAAQLQRARENVASGERLVKIGALAKVEGEQRVLRVIRLEAELAKAQLVTAKAEASVQQTRHDQGQPNQAALDAAVAAVDRATKTAAAAEQKYRQAELDAAALNLRRQKRLFAVGAAHKSDVSRAEEKLAALQRGEEPLR